MAEHELPARLITMLEGCMPISSIWAANCRIDKELASQLGDDDLGQRLMTIPGVGPITASVLAAELVTENTIDGRDFAASVRLVPRQYSTGGRANLNQQGTKILDDYLVQCARAYICKRLAANGTIG